MQKFRNPKKSLGQHFLTAQGIIEKICDYACSRPDAIIVEIGPGRGALTEEILKRGHRMIAIEFDRDLAADLAKRFSDSIEKKQFAIEISDASGWTVQNLRRLLENWGLPESQEILVCGNLPYNVGTEIVMNFYENFPTAKRFVFMLQKEVVLRFVSTGNDADYGPLAVKLAWGAWVLGKFWVKPGCFDPPPRVESGVFCFERLPEPRTIVSPVGEGSTKYQKAGDFVSRVFQQRRKMLRAIDPKLSDSEFAQKRPQELSPKELFKLGLGE